MKIYTHFKITLFLIVFLSTANIINSQIRIDAELRPRAELWDGNKILNDGSRDPAFFVSQRSRLNFNYTNQIYSIGFAIQDVRIWGDEDIYSSIGVFGSTSSIDLYEAWIELQLGSTSRLKIGRQALSYDNQLLISKRNWSQFGLVYNALVYKFKKSRFMFDIGLSYNNETSKVLFNEYPSGKQKTMNYLHLKKQFNDKLSAAFIAIGSGFLKNDSSNVIYMRGSYGANLIYKTNSISIMGSAYYQNGKSRKGLDVSAYFFSVAGQYKLKKFIFGAGVDYLSGQDAGKTDENYQMTDHLFDLLYGKRHIINGKMDMFVNIPVGTANGGLIDLFATISFLPVKKLKLSLDYHYFSLQNNVLNNTVPGSWGAVYLDKNLGNEFDFDFNWTIIKEISLSGGYCFYLPTYSLEIIQGIEAGSSEFSSYAWMMLTVKPTIFTSKK